MPLFERVTVIDLAAEGLALAKVRLEKENDNEPIIFIEKCIPGDIVDVQIIKKQRNFMQGYPVKFHKYSDKRIDAKCLHFGTCGGCKWQNLPYTEQLFYKQKQVIDQLTHIGNIELPTPNEILKSPEEYYYRNKLEFTFSNKRWLQKEEIGAEINNMDALGFHIPGKFDKVLDIDQCYLQGSLSNEIRLAAKEIAQNLNLDFFDLREQKGFLRNLIVRNAESTGDLMVIVSFFMDNKKNRERFLEELAARFPQISSLMYVINPKKNDTIVDLNVDIYKGKNHIVEEMEELKFKIGPKSFFQTNTKQAYQLYRLVRDYASLGGHEKGYDLYTGTGTIANFIASKAKKVIGIEYVEEAIEDAKQNSHYNNIFNTSFFAGDIKDVLNEEFILRNGKPDVIILDPPRAGVHKNVIDGILLADAKKIVYVSCNAATQARDINLLADKYRVQKFCPVDMFPQTAHVENVALLLKK